MCRLWLRRQAGETPRYHQGRELVPRDAVRDLAVRGIKDYRLYEDENARGVLQSGEPGEPLLVQRLDRAGDFYYLTPWETDGSVAAMIDVDARSGAFKSLRLLSKPSREWTFGGRERDGLRKAISEAIDGRVFNLADMRGRFRVYPETYCIPRVLVWKPCRESWSPHLPFYHVVLGGQSLYIRIDGAVFTHLTTGRGA